MKLSRKLMMVSAAALMGISPVLSGTNMVQAATKKTTASSKKTNNGDKTVLGSNAYIYDKNGKRNTNYKYKGKVYKTIGKGSEISTFGTETIKGKLYFSIGNGNYIKAGNVATVNGKKYSASSKKSSSSSSKTSSNKTSSTKSVELTHNAYVYDKNGKRIKSAGTLKKGSTVEYTGTKKIDGKNYYNLGKGQYVKTSNAKKVDTKDDNTPTGTLTHNSYVYDKNGKRIKSVKTLKKGASVKYYGTKTIKNKDYYNLGNGQYIKAANLKPDVDDEVGDDKTIETTYIKLIKNALIYDENGQAVKPTQKLFKGVEYQAAGEGAKKINDVWFYQIGHNQYIKAVNAVVSSGPSLIPADEDPAKPTQDSDATAGTAIATWKESGSLYNEKGETISGTYFAKGHQARVSRLTYLWIKSENKAELFYQVASAKESFVKADQVDISGSTLVPDNTPEIAKDNATDVKANSYAPLKSAIDSAIKAKATDAYLLASPTAKSSFDKALKDAQDNYASTSGNTVYWAKKYMNALIAAQGQLNGKKVQVTDLNNLTSSEQEQIIQVAATANGVQTSAVKFSGSSNLEITSATGYVSTKPVTDYATATPQTAASIN